MNSTTELPSDDDNDDCTGIKWIHSAFGDCVDTDLKVVGFIVGLCSLVCWLIPMFPQMWRNYRMKRCDLSIRFLALWITGDTFNLFGAFVTNQLPIQKVISVYYIFQDGSMLAQYLYYHFIYPRRHRLSKSPTASIAPVLTCTLLGFLAFGYFAVGSQVETQIETAVGGSRRLLFVYPHHLAKKSENDGPFFKDTIDIIGYVLGALAYICYFTGHIPQALANYRRKSMEGLSVSMFAIFAMANITYQISIVLGSSGWRSILRHVPWLVGSIANLSFDLFMCSQFYTYRKREKDSEKL